MRILFVTNDYVGEQRAGPAIRAVELAKVLSRRHQVTLASARPGGLELDGIRVITGAQARPSELKGVASASDIVIAQGLVLFTFPFLYHARYLVVELYDPYLFEYLAHSRNRFPAWGYRRQWHLLNRQLLRGDLFVCANERQWDYWLGRLCALGRLTPEEYKHDKSFRSLLTIVPFGIPAATPVHTRQVVKGVRPGIGVNDIVLLWGGGIWQWFDPLTLIRAIALVARERSDIKLLFLGGRHPERHLPAMPVEDECHRVAQELGLVDRSVFFANEWVSHDQLPNYLLESDIGVSSYWDSVETHFSFRTRVRDCIWAGLPMILTRGDSFATLVEHERVGRTVAASDVEGWRNAILDLAGNSEERSTIRTRLRGLAPKFHWDRVAEPLLEYCERPYRTAAMPGWSKPLIPVLSSGYQFLYRLAVRLQKN